MSTPQVLGYAQSYLNPAFSYPETGGVNLLADPAVVRAGLRSIQPPKPNLSSMASEYLLRIFNNKQYVINKLNAWHKELDLTSSPDKDAALRQLLDFVNNPSLNTLELADLNVKSLPDIFDQPAIKKRLTHFNLTNIAIEALPNSLNDSKLMVIDIKSCPRLTLTDEFKPPVQCLNFESCPLVRIPEDFNPPGLKSLFLKDLQLTSIPRGFNPPEMVRLSIIDCPLTEIEEGFNPPSLKYLVLNNTELTHLPQSFDASNMSEMNFQGTRINALPESVWDMDTYTYISIELNHFSNAVRSNIQTRTSQPEYEGPRFRNLGQQRTLEQNIGDYSHVNLEDVYWDVFQAANEELDHDLLERLTQNVDEEGVGNFKIWLARLFETASAKSEANVGFFKSIVEILREADRNEEMKQVFYTVLETASTTCGDRIALSALHFDIQKQLAQLDTSDPKASYDFLVNTVYVMDILEKTAMNIVPTLSLTDPLEVFLGLPVQLREEFGMRLNVQNMLYFGCSGLTGRHLQQARSNVREKLADEDKLLDFLVDQPKWLETLGRNAGVQFAEAKRRKAEAERAADEADLSESIQMEIAANTAYREELKGISKALLST